MAEQKQQEPYVSGAMETPLAQKRVTRIHASGLLHSASKADKFITSTKKVLMEITNDSPINGVAQRRFRLYESPTPSKSRTRQYSTDIDRTPCSGESLLRYRVKSTMQSVEMDSTKSTPRLPRIRRLNDEFLHSPGIISAAPTPANTPVAAAAAVNGSTFGSPPGFGSIPRLVSEQSTPSFGRLFGDFSKLSSPAAARASVSEANNLLQQGRSDLSVGVIRILSPEKPITRALSFDSPEKTWGSHFSSTKQMTTVIKFDDDPSLRFSSFRSFSDHAQDNDDEEDNYVNEETEEEDEECAELCQGMSEMFVKDKESPLFLGKHTRFI